MVGRKIKIENVVASTALGVKFDLESIAAVFENVQYEPKRFPGLVYKMDKPKVALLIFRPGKIICTGAKSIDDAKLAIRKIVQKIRAIGMGIPDEPVVVVQNLVATVSLHAKLNLEAIAIGLNHTEYEPEQFPGLVYRMADPKVVFLVFGSGKIVITGAKSPEDAERAADNLVENLHELGVL
jgi:transcription initiation factor TFIID TATA-box-binding protein